MKLYIGNLPWSVNEESFKKMFAEHNPEEASLIVDKFNGRSKGFGFVTIADEAVAKKVLEEFNGKEVDGRELKVSEAKPMEDRPKRDFNRDGGNRGGGSFGGGNRGGGNRGGGQQGRRY